MGDFTVQLPLCEDYRCWDGQFVTKWRGTHDTEHQACVIQEQEASAHLGGASLSFTAAWRADSMGS